MVGALKRGCRRMRRVGERGFPEELLTEILIRLPVKFIARSKCVCREWWSTINSPVFAHRHLHHNKHVWVLHEYGVEDSWNKLFTLTLPPACGFLKPWKHGNLLLCAPNKYDTMKKKDLDGLEMVMLDPTTQQMTSLQIRISAPPFPYKESLVALN